MNPDHDDHDTVPATLEELRPWLRDMRQDIRRNGETIRRIDENTQVIVETFAAAQGFWRVVGWVGDAGARIAKVFVACALTGGAAWLWLKGFFETRPGGH